MSMAMMQEWGNNDAMMQSSNDAGTNIVLWTISTRHQHNQVLSHNKSPQ